LKRNLIIQSTKQGLDIALVENDKLVEFHQDVVNKEYLVGDIYLGEVKKILPGLNACFVDIGFEKNGFLHYFDLGPNIKNQNAFVKKAYRNKSFSSSPKHFNKEKEIVKTGDIPAVVEPGQKIAVQIMKEPISTKGHRLGSQLTLPGMYIVLIPFGNGISLSRRIRNNKERKRLISIFQDLIPGNFGVIVRTAAENKQAHFLEKDLSILLARWEQIVENLKAGNSKLLGEYDKATSLIRDMLNESFDNIIVNDRDTYNELDKYLSTISTVSKNVLKFHSERKLPFEYYHIDRQIKSAFGKIFNFGKGGYLVIEQTEAMYVVDVNSGSKNNSEATREENVLKINMDAADEIARQLRLRDIGGLIIVDFIDMRSSANKKALYNKMKEAFKNDRTQHSLSPLSKFGLMEITRQRVKPALEISTAETCPVCKGSGELKPTILVTDDIEHSLNFIKSELNVKSVYLKVHPFVATYLKSGWISMRLKWMFEYKLYIGIAESEAMQLIDYLILNKEGKDLEEF